ncbi:C4-dicarboxylate ABC transporter substrate-binding protein [Paraburkholderia monticola]|uniref:C4-dicarboxylate ABC transporter substrate-binding protein n=1 Tax=Paraburkholderia monticola TaxID=1399968 RepID=A0A149PKH4_9BURK|nr:tripartite tricarboxylate transporter substrate binding protein [Paraburkholderia monticola]KXU85557.1 C4-dicarboxylate ABC transporter substrate-binding protein [Paraburkholderia monticola]
MISRRNVLGVLIASGCLGWRMGARAAGYPDAPVRLVLPYTAGSDDVQARLVARTLGHYLGQPIVVEAHAGAGGNIAAHYTAHASADGYTMLFAINSLLEVNPLMYRDPGFDPLADFTQVAPLAEHQFMLVVNPRVPANSVRELIDYAKKNPGKLTNATAGAGSALYLAGMLFMTKAGIGMVNVPYKGGADDTLAVLAGDVDMEFGGIPNVAPYVKDGRLRALAVSGTQRSPLYPDLPTVAQAGVPGFDFTAWSSLAVPAATPAPVVQVLRTAVAKTMADPDLRRDLDKLGFVPLAGSGDELRRRIETESAQWRQVFEHAGIKPS